LASGDPWGEWIIRIRDNVQTRDRENRLVALRMAQTAARVDPDNARLQQALARTALVIEDYAIAEAAYRAAVGINPLSVESWNGLAHTLTRVCRTGEALAAAEQAIRINPKSAAAHVTRSDVLRDLHRYDEAQAGFATALWLKPNWPDACYNRAFLQFALGRYEAGWRDYARRWETEEFGPEQDVFQLKPSLVRHGPRWGGAPLPAGTRLFVWGEQGHGDTLWGLRYLDRLLERHPGVSVVLQVQRPVERQCWITYRDRVTVVSRETDPPPWDLHVPLLNLPNALGLWRPEDAPAARLRVEDGDAVPHGPTYRVGIVWGGSLSHANDPRRSTALGDWLPVLRVPGVQCVSLQIGPRADEGAPLFEAGVLVDPRPMIRDFADTANLLAGIDLVIGVDTGTLHLAAGLGVPTWWLIGESPDWRYSYRGDDPTGNVWYERARLWRKPHGVGWDGVFADVAAALADRVRA